MTTLLEVTFMQEIEQVRTPLNEYYKNDDLKVHHMNVRDNTDGALILKRLLNASFDKWQRMHFMPETDNKYELPGLYIAPMTTDESVVVFIFSSEGELEVVCNDEYVAKKLLVDFIFGGRETFNELVGDLVISEEWTEAAEFYNPFFNALMCPDNPDD